MKARLEVRGFVASTLDLCLYLVVRLLWVVGATVFCIFIPSFSDLTAITAAVSIVPLSFILPIVFWNRTHGASASKGRMVFHYAFITIFALIGVAALVGGIYDIVQSF